VLWPPSNASSSPSAFGSDAGEQVDISPLSPLSFFFTRRRQDLVAVGAGSGWSQTTLKLTVNLNIIGQMVSNRTTYSQILFVDHTFRRLAALLSSLFLLKNIILPRWLPLHKVNFRHRQRVFHEPLGLRYKQLSIKDVN
jgi:hypothetical protein